MPTDDPMHDQGGVEIEADCDEPGEGSELDACRRCGYSLAGISAEGVCPECGQPAAWSLGEDLLINADPTFVRRIHRALPALHAAIVATGLWVLLFAAVNWMIWTKHPSLRSTFAALVVTVVIVATLFVPVVFLVTPEDPGADETDKEVRDKARRKSCYGLGLVIAAVIAFQFGPPAGWSGGGAGGGGVQWKHVYAGLALLALWVMHDSISATCQHVRLLALRVPCDIERTSRIAGKLLWSPWLLIIVYIFKNPDLRFAVYMIIVATSSAALAISLFNLERVRRGVARIAAEQARRAGLKPPQPGPRIDA